MSFKQQSARNTYELESFSYNKINSPKSSNLSPIILYKAGNSQSNNPHSHRYLFYPSMSRLSPYSNDISDFNIVKNINSRNNNYTQEINLTNRIYDEEKNNSPQYNNRLEGGESNTYFNKRIHNRGRSMGEIRDEEKYKEMFDKSLQLMKTISDLMPEEDAKIKGDSSYYYNRDRDYDNIIEKQKNFLKKYFKTNNEGFIGNESYKNDNYFNSPNEINKTYGQFQNKNILDGNNNLEIGDNSREDLTNKSNNNFNKYNNEYSGINSRSTNFNKDNNFGINSENNIIIGNKDNNFGNNKINVNKDNISNYDNQEINPNNKIFNRTTNDNFNLRSGNNLGDNKEFSTFPNNINNMNLNDIKDINNKDRNNNYNNRNYINDYENTMNSKIGNKKQIKPKTILQMEDQNNSYYNRDSRNENSQFKNENNDLSNPGGIEKNMKNENNLEINNNLDNNYIKDNQNYNTVMSGLSTKDFVNTNYPNIQNNKTKNNPLSRTENNLEEQLSNSNGNKKIFFQSMPDNDNENQFSLTNNRNTNKNGNNTNINGDKNINNDIDNNQIEDIKDLKKSKIMALYDENNQKILSPEGEPYEGERAVDIYEKDNKIFVTTKSGAKLKLSLLQDREGKPLFAGDNPLLGKEKKFFFDKNKKPIVYPDENYMEGEQRIPVKIKEIRNSNIYDDDYNINNSNNSQNYYNIGIGGGGVSEMKRTRHIKNKSKFFPKGEGDAKPPNKKKRKTKKLKKK